MSSQQYEAITKIMCEEKMAYIVGKVDTCPTFNHSD
jgi:hypothetical protein